MSFCLKCGNKLAEDAKFCNKCGNKQDVSNSIPDTAPPPPPPSGDIQDSEIIGDHGGDEVEVEAPDAGDNVNFGEEKKECGNCEIIINSDNQGVKCSICGLTFCKALEMHFREIPRSNGEPPLCEKHYKEEKTRIEQEHRKRDAEAKQPPLPESVPKPKEDDVDDMLADLLDGL